MHEKDIHLTSRCAAPCDFFPSQLTGEQAHSVFHSSRRVLSLSSFPRNIDLLGFMKLVGATPPRHAGRVTASYDRNPSKRIGDYRMLRSAGFATTQFDFFYPRRFNDIQDRFYRLSIMIFESNINVNIETRKKCAVNREKYRFCRASNFINRLFNELDRDACFAIPFVTIADADR